MVIKILEILLWMLLLPIAICGIILICVKTAERRIDIQKRYRRLLPNNEKKSRKKNEENTE